MKLLHTSDLHLSSPLTSHLPAERARIRRREMLEVFHRLTEAAKREGCAGIIIAGDLFDSERVTEIALSDILDTIRRESALSFYYLPGNHEGELIRRSGAELPKNLYIFGEGWTSFARYDTVITGRTSLARGAFDELSLDRTRKNVVVLHGELRDTSDVGVIGRRDAIGRGINYLALGHYHSFSEERLDGNTVAVYCGTPEGRGFDEVGEKGYVIIDTDKAKIVPRFVPFAKRQIHHVRLPLDGIMTQGELTERVGDALAKIPDTSLVRLELCGSYREGAWKSLETLRARYENAFFYFEIKDTSRMALEPERLKHDKTLKGEFIRLVMNDESISPDMKDKIISCGLYSLIGIALYEE